MRGTHKNLYSLKKTVPIHELITSYIELITFLLTFQLVINIFGAPIIHTEASWEATKRQRLK